MNVRGAVVLNNLPALCLHLLPKPEERLAHVVRVLAVRVVLRLDVVLRVPQRVAVQVDRRRAAGPYPLHRALRVCEGGGAGSVHSIPLLLNVSTFGIFRQDSYQLLFASG